MVVIDADTTVAEIDEAIGHLCERRAMGAPIVRAELGKRIDGLLDARLELSGATTAT